MRDLSGSRRSPAFIESAVVRMQPPAWRSILRGGPPVMSAAGEGLGFVISGEACRSARASECAALWLGPDEQLLLASAAVGPDMGRLLEERLAALPHSLVDVSHRQIGFEVRGALAQTVLSVGCPLDLAITEFPTGMCTRTLLGKADVVLWRIGADVFHVEVWRSFADYLSRFLAEAARELAC